MRLGLLFSLIPAIFAVVFALPHPQQMDGTLPLSDYPLTLPMQMLG